MRRLAIVSAAFALAAGFYLLLIDTPDLPELYAGLGVTLLAVLAFELSRGHGHVPVAIAPIWLAGSWRVLARVPVSIVLVSRTALEQLVRPRPSRGEFRAIPFEAGGEHARDAGRRALAETVGSLTPDTIILGIDHERKLLLAHQLRRGGGRDRLDVLRLG